MGRIPHFQETIFPKESLPFLNLIATLGLIFFLFQVGLEVDLRIVKRDWKQSVSIAFAGMALPFGLGAAVSVGLYKLQDESNIPFSSFVLFLGVAMAITVSTCTDQLLHVTESDEIVGFSCISSYIGRTQAIAYSRWSDYHVSRPIE
jgi:Kef-type K+ transport system membrane component KefB